LADVEGIVFIQHGEVAAEIGRRGYVDMAYGDARVDGQPGSAHERGGGHERDAFAGCEGHQPRLGDDGLDELKREPWVEHCNLI